MTPRVSVIVAAHNAAATIERALRSALAQTLAEIEVIVVDDASSDDTAVRVAALQREDARIVLLRHPGNRGPGAARNTAIAASRGAWLAPLDADDEFHPERLARLGSLGEEQNADLMADNLAFDDGSSTGAPLEHAYAASLLERASPLTPAALIASNMPRDGVCSFGYLKPLIRRDFLARHGLRYDEDLRVTEDFNLYVSAVLVGARFCCTGWAGYRYRRTPGSMTRSPTQFLQNLEYATEGNRRLAVLAERVGDRATLVLLRHQRVRQQVFAWMDRLKLALRARDAAAIGRVALQVPPHPLVLLRIVLTRLVRGRRRNPASGPGR